MSHAHVAPPANNTTRSISTHQTLAVSGKYSGNKIGNVFGKSGKKLNHTHPPRGEYETTGNDSGNKDGKSGKNGNAPSYTSNEPIPGSACIRPHHHRHTLQNSGKNGNDPGNISGLSSYHTNR